MVLETQGHEMGISASELCSWPIARREPAVRKVPEALTLPGSHHTTMKKVLAGIPAMESGGSKGRTKGVARNS